MMGPTLCFCHNLAFHHISPPLLDAPPSECTNMEWAEVRGKSSGRFPASCSELRLGGLDLPLEAVDELGTVLERSPAVKRLDLTSVGSFGAPGAEALAAALARSRVRALAISMTPIGDRGVAAVALLAAAGTLQELDLY